VLYKLRRLTTLKWHESDMAVLEGSILKLSPGVGCNLDAAWD